MVAFFPGIAILRVGLASSCSPRAFIRSTIFCGRGITVRDCAPGGVAAVVAVVFAFSFDCWQPAISSVAVKQRRKTLGILISLSNRSITRLKPSKVPQGRNIYSIASASQLKAPLGATSTAHEWAEELIGQRVAINISSLRDFHKTFGHPTTSHR